MQSILTEVTEINDIGLELFGSQPKFQMWLSTKNFALGNVTPSSLMDDAKGRELVIRELTNISHGIFV